MVFIPGVDWRLNFGWPLNHVYPWLYSCKVLPHNRSGYPQLGHVKIGFIRQFLLNYILGNTRQ